MDILSEPHLTDVERLEVGREYLRLLRKSLIRLRSLASDLIEPHGLTSQQFLLLLCVRDREGITQAELALELDSDPNTISGMIGRLGARKLITRKRHHADGRATCLFVTELGKQLVAETLPDVDRLSLHLFSLVPREHRAIITDWLRAVASLRTLADQ